MKITCDRQILSDAINVVSRAVSTKSSMPALEGILIKAWDGLFLSAYDLELGISTAIPASVDEPGDIVLDAKLFVDIIRKLPAERVEITTDEKLLTTIICGSSQFTLLGIPANDFPEIPVLGTGTVFELPQNLLKSMIKQTLFAVAVGDAKPIQTGILFELTAGILKLVSVDGYRLALRSEKVNCDEKLSFVVPGKTLNEIEKLLGIEDTPIRISNTRKQILFELNNYSIISRLLEGEFIDYNNAIPKDSKTEIIIKTRDISNSVERAALLISDRLKSPVKMIIDDEKIEILCTTAIGKIHDVIDAKIKGATFEIGFNNKYLIDALRATDCDEVRLILNGPLSPMKILPPKDEAFIFLVLPVRLKNE